MTPKQMQEQYLKSNKVTHSEPAGTQLDDHDKVSVSHRDSNKRLLMGRPNVGQHKSTRCTNKQGSYLNQIVHKKIGTLLKWRYKTNGGGTQPLKEVTVTDRITSGRYNLITKDQ